MFVDNSLHPSPDIDATAKISSFSAATSLPLCNAAVEAQAFPWLKSLVYHALAPEKVLGLGDAFAALLFYTKYCFDEHL